MGTGVGEAALAAEIAGGAEAATAGAGFLEGMAGVSALEGAGVAGLGLGTGAGLAGAGAGGLGALSPAFQTALGETAVFNPEIAAQTAQFANVGAVPQAGTQFAPAFADVGGTGASAGLPFPTGGMQVTPPMPALSPASAADVAQFADIGGPSSEASAWDAATAGQYGGQPAPSSGFGLSDLTRPLKATYDWYKEQDPLTQGAVKYGGMGLGALGASKALNKPGSVPGPEKYTGPLSKFSYDPSTYTPYTYKPYAAGGPVEQMSRDNALGANTGYPQADIQQGAYATPWQTPVSRNVVAGAGDANVDQMTGLERMAGGGIASLGGYSDGGRLLRGPGDGMSDNIPANISGKQPARLADGEFVVSADVVSGLGNGSTDAGAKRLYKMMDRVRQARTGTKKQGREINPDKYTPA